MQRPQNINVSEVQFNRIFGGRQQFSSQHDILCFDPGEFPSKIHSIFTDQWYRRVSYLNDDRCRHLTRWSITISSVRSQIKVMYVSQSYRRLQLLPLISQVWHSYPTQQFPVNSFTKAANLMRPDSTLTVVHWQNYSLEIFF